MSLTKFCPPCVPVQRPLLFALTVFLCLPAFPSYEMVSGVAERISDGDTLRLHEKDGQLRVIRLAGIDAPEKGQDFGHRASRRLAYLCLGKKVDADIRTKDKYGRTVARVRCDGQDVAHQLLLEGLAWHYKRFANTQPSQEALEDTHTQLEAQRKQIGLWSQTDPTPPWVWRANQAKSKASKNQIESVGSRD